MKTIISSLFMIITILFFSRKEANKDIAGTWKLNLYTMDSDTIYYENHEKYTFNYFEKTLGSLKNADEKNKIAEKLYHQFKTAELHINKNKITSYQFDGDQSKIDLKYKMVGGNIVLDEKSNQKYKYKLDYNPEKNILSLQLGDSKMNVITRYSRVKN